VITIEVCGPLPPLETCAILESGRPFFMLNSSSPMLNSSIPKLNSESFRA